MLLQAGRQVTVSLGQSRGQVGSISVLVIVDDLAVVHAENHLNFAALTVLIGAVILPVVAFAFALPGGVHWEKARAQHRGECQPHGASCHKASVASGVSPQSYRQLRQQSRCPSDMLAKPGTAIEALAMHRFHFLNFILASYNFREYAGEEKWKRAAQGPSGLCASRVFGAWAWDRSRSPSATRLLKRKRPSESWKRQRKSRPVDVTHP